MALYRKLSLTVKFVLVVCLVIVIIFFLSLIANLLNLRSVSISNGELEAEVAGRSYAETIKNSVVDLESTAQLFTEVLLESRKHGTQKREDVIATMTTMLENRPELMGISTLWEPNAFDQNDKANVNKMPYDDSTGRFIPYIYRNEGSIVVESLKDYNVEGAGNYYLVPKEASEEG